MALLSLIMLAKPSQEMDYQRGNGTMVHQSGGSLIEDFNEEDVWDVLIDRRRSSKKYVTPIIASRKLPSAARMIPRADVGSKSKHSSSSVPISDWSTSSENKSAIKPLKFVNQVDNVISSDEDDIKEFEKEDNEEDSEDDDYKCKQPPHEIIAKRLAKAHISSFSVFEGVGRTLKGRDLERLRNSVLIRTGFLESL